MNIPSVAVYAAQQAGDSFGLELASRDIERLLEAAAPHIAAQALRDTADLLYTDNGTPHPLSTATWLRSLAAAKEAPNA